MISKKTLLSGFALSFLVSSFAHASLTTYNYTKQDSTVKVSSNNNICAGQPPFSKYTPASKDGINPGVSKANMVEIIGLCMKDPCQADIYMNKTCSGQPVAKAILSGVGTDNHTVRIAKIIDTKYKITAKGNVVNLEMAS